MYRSRCRRLTPTPRLNANASPDTNSNTSADAETDTHANTKASTNTNTNAKTNTVTDTNTNTNANTLKQHKEGPCTPPGSGEVSPIAAACASEAACPRRAPRGGYQTGRCTGCLS